MNDERSRVQTRSADSPKGFGDVLIQDAVKLLRSAKSVVGCRMLRLDCTDELVSYYSRHGVVRIRRDDEQDLNQIMTFI